MPGVDALVNNAEASKVLQEVIIGDIGTGDAGFTKFLFDPQTGIVYGEEKWEVKKCKDAAAFANAIVTYLNDPARVNIHTIINMTSWARDPNKFDAEVIAELKKIETVAPQRIISANVISQAEEAELGDLSSKYVISHKNPNNEKMKNITPAICIQFEGGKGSAQSFVALREQMEEKCGNWAADLLMNKSKTLSEISKSFEIDTLSQLTPPEQLVNKHAVVTHGIFGVGLQDDALFKDLDLDKQQAKDWGTAQLPLNIDVVIAALENKVRGCDQKLNTLINCLEENESFFDHYCSLHKTAENEESKREEILSRQEIISFLSTIKIEQDKETRKQIPQVQNLPFDDDELKEMLASACLALDGASKAVASALTLGGLMALNRRYPNINLVLNAKNPSPIFNADGSSAGEAKIAGSLGAALKHFREINVQKNYEVKTELVGKDSETKVSTFHMPKVAERIAEIEEKILEDCKKRRIYYRAKRNTETGVKKSAHVGLS